VRNIDVPVLLIQPPKDQPRARARPRREAARAHKTRFTAKIHRRRCPKPSRAIFGGAPGFHNWAVEAIAFFAVLK
jgi:hypothetical protein